MEKGKQFIYCAGIIALVSAACFGLSGIMGYRVAALILFLLGILMAEGRSAFSPERPLQSNLWYLLDADAGKASWISDHTTTDRFNRQYLKQARSQEGISRRGAGLVSEAAPITVAPPTAHLISDSTVMATGY